MFPSLHILYIRYKTYGLTLKYFAPNPRMLFGCSSVLIIVNKRKAIFLDDYLKSCNNFCKLFAYVAENEKKESQDSDYSLHIGL